MDFLEFIRRGQAAQAAADAEIAKAARPLRHMEIILVRIAPRTTTRARFIRWTIDGKLVAEPLELSGNFGPALRFEGSALVGLAPPDDEPTLVRRNG